MLEEDIKTVRQSLQDKSEEFNNSVSAKKALEDKLNKVKSLNKFDDH